MDHSKFYRFIVAPEYRIWRHICFVLTLAIISFNQVLIAYQADAAYLGTKIYVIGLMSFSTYCLATYVNYFVLIPRFLLQEQYRAYVLMLIIFVCLLMLVTIYFEYETRTFLGLTHRIKSYRNPLILIDSLSSSVLTIICFWSMSAVELFRTRNKKNDQIISLEQQFLESEVNKLKGQVSPLFLSKALRKASSLAQLQPDKSSQILMQVGQLLRYQLYDCNREKVFIHSEINFITQFLHLNKLISEQHFEYTVDVKGRTNQVFISPLLLIVLIQTLLEKKEIADLKINIESLNKQIVLSAYFTTACILQERDFVEVTAKLNRLYPHDYQWNIESGKVQLQINV